MSATKFVAATTTIDQTANRYRAPDGAQGQARTFTARHMKERVGNPQPTRLRKPAGGILSDAGNARNFGTMLAKSAPLTKPMMPLEARQSVSPEDPAE
jgi:hypothetical protein